MGPHVSPARALCSLDLITPLMHLEASVAPTACWACYVPVPQADQIPDSRAHTCPPHTEHLTLFRGDLSSRSSEAARQEWPELSATCPTAPGPACASQVYRHVRSKAVSHVQIVSPWFFAEHSFLVTSAWWHIGSSLIQPSGPHVMTLKWIRRVERCCDNRLDMRAASLAPGAFQSRPAGGCPACVCDDGALGSTPRSWKVSRPSMLATPAARPGPCLQPLTAPQPVPPRPAPPAPLGPTRWTHRRANTGSGHHALFLAEPSLCLH